MTLLLDGKSVSAETEKLLSERVENLKIKKGFVPTLATILVGDDPASATYVKMKGNACKRVGMKSLKVELPGSTSTEELLTKIQELWFEQYTYSVTLVEYCRFLSCQKQK